MSGSELHGQRVVVTRAAHQADALVEALKDRGARVERLPLIELTPPPYPDDLRIAATMVPTIDWLVFTSANAVTAFLPHVRRPLVARCAVVGPASASALKSYGIEPALEATQSRATGLLAELKPLLPTPSLSPPVRVLIPQAEDARPDLVDGLRDIGVEVTAFAAYSKRQPPEAAGKAENLFAHSPIGWVTCTSPRIARHFAELFGAAWPRRRDEMKALSIGPVTSEALREFGVETVGEAAQPSDSGLVEAMLKAVADAA